MKKKTAKEGKRPRKGLVCKRTIKQPVAFQAQGLGMGGAMGNSLIQLQSGSTAKMPKPAGMQKIFLLSPLTSMSATCFFKSPDPCLPIQAGVAPCNHANLATANLLHANKSHSTTPPPPAHDTSLHAKYSGKNNCGSHQSSAWSDLVHVSSYHA